MEHRYGYADDDPLTLYTNQVIEESIGVDLELLFERDDTGKQLATLEDPEPVKRSTGRRCKRAVLILRWPLGLGRVQADGDKKSFTVEFTLRTRKAGTDTWVSHPDISITKRKFAEFYQAISIEFDEAAAYEIELTRLTQSEFRENNKGSLSAACTWAVLQTHREEYPINAGVPLALTAVRVRGTHKRAGMLDNFNCMVRRVTDGFGIGWPTDIPSNPATSALFVLLGTGGLVEPRTIDVIDQAFFEEWRDFCNAKGLKLDIDGHEGRSLEEWLTVIGAAGRAAIFFDGSQWTGIIDRPRTVPVDLITPQNSSGASHETAYVELPHAFRVKFADATNDYEGAERIVRNPYHSGPIVTTEAIEMPGKTDPDEIYREAVRRFHELRHRNTVYTLTMEDMVRSASRGDLVHMSLDTLRRAMASGTVLAVRGRQVELNERIEFKEGVTYAARWRSFEADDDIGTHQLATLLPVSGETSVFTLAGAGPLPSEGDLVVIGEAGQESIPLILTGIRRNKDQKSELVLLPAAPEIDELTDATEIPEWDGKIGEVIDLTGVAPLTPLFASVISDMAADEVTIELGPDPANTLPLASYVLDHRLAGESVWTSVSVPAASSNVTLTAYAPGDTVEIRAAAVTIYGAQGPYTDIETVVVGEEMTSLGGLDFSDPDNSAWIAGL